jgi:hypothetical protein
MEPKKYYVAALYEVGAKGWTPISVVALSSPSQHLTLSTGQVVEFGPSESAVHAPSGKEQQSATADCTVGGPAEAERQ